MPAKIYVLNGPNLNLLGFREPTIYGNDSLDDIGRMLAKRAEIKSINVPVIEVHISDPTVREEFRRTSFVGMGAVATVQGMGSQSYLYALEKAVAL